ncbi:PAP2 family phosphatase PhoN2, partial [Shigella sonnei]
MKTKNFLLFCIATNMIFIPSANALKAEGFLTQQTSPDSLSILPPPPAEDSVVFQADKAHYEFGRSLRDANRV